MKLYKIICIYLFLFYICPWYNTRPMFEKLTRSNAYPWVVVGLLWVVALLNYMDRQMLSTMQEAMKADIFELQKAEAFGALMAVFLWVYALLSPFAGMVADRLSRKWLIVGSLGVWSTVTLLMGLCTSFTQMYVLRGLMGIVPQEAVLFNDTVFGNIAFGADDATWG